MKTGIDSVVSLDDVSEVALKFNFLVPPDQKAEIQRIVSEIKMGVLNTGRYMYILSRTPTFEEDTIITTLLDLAELRVAGTYTPWRGHLSAVTLTVYDAKKEAMLRGLGGNTIEL